MVVYAFATVNGSKSLEKGKGYKDRRKHKFYGREEYQ